MTRPRSSTLRARPAAGRSRSWLVYAAALLFGVLSLGFAPPPSEASPAEDPASDEAPPALAGQIDVVLSEPFLAGATIGVSVVDLKSGETLYERGENIPLNPASNVKLVTTASALALLGPEHRYPTQVLRKDGALEGSLVKGDIYLRGSGDPNLVTEHLLAMAGKLAARGVKRIGGGVVVDTSAFDRDELPPGFDQKEELASYRAPSGAASLNFNTFVVHVQPGAASGSAATAGIDPPVPSIKLTNAVTTAEGYRTRVFADVEFKGERIEVALKGTIGVDAGAKAYRYPIQNPSVYAGEAFAWALQKRGIKLGRRKIKIGTAPLDARLLVSHNSPPLSVLIRAVNKFSNNFMAEQLLKTIGASTGTATFEGALERVRGQLQTFGVEGKGLRLGNGSGLYDTNRVSAAQFTSLLAAVYADYRISADFLASLAVMGADGTVRSRLRDTVARRYVKVKTGTLDGISALSGYAGAQGRRPIAFSILFNDLQRSDRSRARAAQDRIAELIARHAADLPLHEPVQELVEQAAQ